MASLKLILCVVVFIASCESSGVAPFITAVRSVPIVRYAPYYNFPNGVRSIHAVAPAIPALAPAFSPPPVFSAIGPAFPPQAGPSFTPAFSAVAPAPVFGGAFPALPAVPAFAPNLRASAFPAFRAIAPAPHVPHFTSDLAPHFAPVPHVPHFTSALAPHFAPVPHGPHFAHAFPAAPITPPPVAVAKTVPYNIGPYDPYHLHNKLFTSAAPNQLGW